MLRPLVGFLYVPFASSTCNTHFRSKNSNAGNLAFWQLILNNPLNHFTLLRFRTVFYHRSELFAQFLAAHLLWPIAYVNQSTCIWFCNALGFDSKVSEIQAFLDIVSWFQNSVHNAPKKPRVLTLLSVTAHCAARWLELVWACALIRIWSSLYNTPSMDINCTCQKACQDTFSCFIFDDKKELHRASLLSISL